MSWGFVLCRLWIPLKFGFFVVSWTIFLLLSRDQYLFKNRPTDGPPNSFYRSLYPKIIQDIEVRFLIYNIRREITLLVVSISKLVHVGAMKRIIVSVSPLLCELWVFRQRKKYPQQLPAARHALTCCLTPSSLHSKLFWTLLGLWILIR